jgi:hypothetical protein
VDPLPGPAGQGIADYGDESLQADAGQLPR